MQQKQSLVGDMQRIPAVRLLETPERGLRRSTLHQNLRLRLSATGTGEFAMKAVTDSNWRTWTLPTYGGENVAYPRFQKIKDACDAILIGNRADMTHAAPGVIIHSAYIKEYNG
ncbi:MAG: hypothetical protein V8S27_09150 [Lachnospiraceae bacterium]